MLSANLPHFLFPMCAFLELTEIIPDYFHGFNVLPLNTYGGYSFCNSERGRYEILKMAVLIALLTMYTIIA